MDTLEKELENESYFKMVNNSCVNCCVHKRFRKESADDNTIPEQYQNLESGDGNEQMEN